MATNLDLDPKLVEEVVKTGRYRTKKEAVTAALEEFVRRRKQAEIVDLFGTIDFDPAYDYKAERQSKRMSVPSNSAPSKPQNYGRKRRPR